jgi:hypothetical protein
MDSYKNFEPRMLLTFDTSEFEMNFFNNTKSF